MTRVCFLIFLICSKVRSFVDISNTSLERWCEQDVVRKHQKAIAFSAHQIVSVHGPRIKWNRPVGVNNMKPVLLNLWYLDGIITFKKGHLFVKLASKPGRPEIVVNDRNVNTMWAIFQENRHGMWGDNGINYHFECFAFYISI